MRDDTVIIQGTIVTPELLVCPVGDCEFYIYAPPVPVVDGIGEALGMSGRTLAAMHAEQEGKRVVQRMREHLKGHEPEDWLPLLLTNRLRGES